MFKKQLTYSELEDKQLLEHCLKGDQKAYKEIYHRYSGYCYTISIRYGVPEIEVKDCLQIIFSEIFKALPKYDSDLASFKTWMTRIAINQILVWMRKKKIRFEDIDEDKSIFISEYGDAGEKMDEEFILRIVGQMPKQYLTVFNLSIIDGFSHKEISEQLNISEGKSRILLMRGRKWAMEKLANHFNTDFSTKLAK